MSTWIPLFLLPPFWAFFSSSQAKNLKEIRSELSFWTQEETREHFLLRDLHWSESSETRREIIASSLAECNHRHSSRPVGYVRDWKSQVNSISSELEITKLRNWAPKWSDYSDEPQVWVQFSGSISGAKLNERTNSQLRWGSKVRKGKSSFGLEILH